jgi:hypothetical protein
MNVEIKHKTSSFVEQIKHLFKEAQIGVLRSVNTIMVQTYFNIGKRIVEEEQNGNERAGYGKYLISELSKKLSEEFGKGFSKRNLEQMRQFYITYSIAQAVPAQLKLSWSHYLVLMRVNNNIKERNFYEIESISNN